MKKYLIILAGLFLPSLSFASCEQFYPAGKTISVVKTIELCNSFFVTVYDDLNKRALFSSELLQPDNHDVPRKNLFHADKRSVNPVKPQEYARSGFDKGHIVPADDAVTPSEMFDTFLMTNMTPQNSVLNRGPWKKLETQIRKVVKSSGKPAIVVTGAIYEGDKMLGRVPVPTGYFKIVYVDGSKTGAFYADNNAVSRPHPVQISWVNAKSGINFPQ